MTHLQHITPDEAVELYLDSRSHEVADSTYHAHKSRLGHFVRWCEGDGEIESMNDLSGIDFNRYKIWRREDGDLNNVTVNTQLHTLRVFIKWAESIDAVRPGLHEYITPPSMAPKEDVRTVILDDEAAADIQRHLRKFFYATRNHVIFELLWHTGMRMGALRALDLDDFKRESQCIEARHRPETDTPLKNGITGERNIALKDDVHQILCDYIDYHRPSKQDEYGRKPLITTRQGRISKGAVRVAVYCETRPCEYLGSCPHSRDIDSCEATQGVHSASKCPSSVSPHALRKGSITWARLNDVPIEAVSKRMDVSPEILNKHYDQRTKDEEMEARRDYFEDL